MPPGTKLDVEYLRDGKKLSARMVLSEIPPEVSEAEGPVSAEEEISKFLSMLSVADLSEDVRKELKLPSQVKGAVVVDVAPGSSAADAGLQLGDIVQEVNKQPVTNSKALTAMNGEIKPGQKLLLRVWSRGKSGYVALNNQ
jgi:serine protease Do